MEYGYKPTTTGRAILAACLSTQTPLVLTRVAMGCGKVPEGMDLADVHELISYVAEGSLGDRRHENDRLYLTVQYENSANPEVDTFFLSEFIIYAIHPDTGEEADLLYATLGDYQQPVPAFNASLPPSVWKFPLVLVVSDKVEVSIDTPPGLVTYEEMQAAVANASGIKKSIDFSIAPEEWVEDPEAANDFRYYFDLMDEDVTAKMVPDIVIGEDCLQTAFYAGVCATAHSHDGFIRIKSMEIPEAAIEATCHLFTMRKVNNIIDNEDPIVPGDVDIADDSDVADMIDDIFG